MKKKQLLSRWKRWRLTLWSDRPFYSVLEQRAFDLELARAKAQSNVALTISKVAYGLR